MASKQYDKYIDKLHDLIFYIRSCHEINNFSGIAHLYITTTKGGGFQGYIKSYQGALEDINEYIRRVNHKCAPSYFMRGLIRMELYDIQGACQDWFNAKYLGHPQAQEYLKKYKQFKVDKPEFDKRGS